MAAGNNDWLVDDSEGENEFELLLQDLPGAPKATSVASTIQDSSFVTPRTPERVRQIPEGFLLTPPGAPGVPSTIDNFTDATSTSGAIAPAPPRPRPRPRVVIKKAPYLDYDSSVPSTSFSYISDPLIPATRTNDSIQPVTSTPFGVSEPVDDIYSSLDIAERAKMRSRKSQTAKKAIPYEAQDVIELTSDEDEITLKPKKRQKKQGSPRPAPKPKPKAQTRPRPKPTLRVKRSVASPYDSPSSLIEIHGPPARPAQPASSQGPGSTLPTIPPSTPPQAGGLSPLSSPLVPTRKRKRIPPLISEDDEMYMIGDNLTRAAPSCTMPLPFFPSSSSAPTDSGIEIPSADSLGGRSKEASSSKKEKQNKGRKGKKTEITGTVDETVKWSAQESGTPAMSHDPSFAEECHSPVIKTTLPAGKAKGKRILMKTGETGAIDSCEEEDELILPPKSNTSLTPLTSDDEGARSKKNSQPHEHHPPKRDPPPPESTSTPDSRAHGFSVKPRLTPMSELIRRVNSHQSSPFPNAARTYSPFSKSSRTMLAKIAPLHPNRRPPPPPLPRPPPPKKSKKQLEMEERIEEELAETIEGWSCLTDEERRALRKARIDAELGYE